MLAQVIIAIYWLIVMNVIDLYQFFLWAEHISIPVEILAWAIKYS